MDKLVKEFTLEKVQNTNPVFDQKKLNYFNGKAIRAKSDQELLTLLKPHLQYSTNDKLLLQIIPLIKARITTLEDANSLIGFFFAPPPAPQGLKYLEGIEKVLLQVNWDKANIESALIKLVDDNKYHKGDFFMSLRLAVCGQPVTPPLTESMLILGRDEVISRIHHAQQNS